MVYDSPDVGRLFYPWELKLEPFFKFPQTDPQSSQCALKGASHYLQSCTSHSILQAGTANTARLSFHVIH